MQKELTVQTIGSRVFEQNIRLVLTPAEDEAVRSEAAGIARYLVLPPTCDYRGFMIKVDALTGSAQRLFDHGDLLPEWAFYWLKLCTVIVQHSAARGDVAALLVPSKKLVLPLSVGDVCAEIASNAWKSEAEVFMLWGAEATIFKRTPFPIRCAGAVFPIIDGVGIGWAATATDIERLDLLVGC